MYKNDQLTCFYGLAGCGKTSQLKIRFFARTRHTMIVIMKILDLQNVIKKILKELIHSIAEVAFQIQFGKLTLSESNKLQYDTNTILYS